MSRSKEYKAIKNYIHNELGLTIEQLIEIMVDNKLSNKDFNIIPRTVEKTSKDKMLNDIEIVIINKGNYIPVYTSLSIIITNSHKLIGIEFVRNKERR